MIGDDPCAEILDCLLLEGSGRRAFHGRRSCTVTSSGAHGSEDADMSNEKAREIRARRKPKVSRATFFVPGLVGPKEKRTAFFDGHRVNTPEPLTFKPGGRFLIKRDPRKAPLYTKTSVPKSTQMGESSRLRRKSETLLRNSAI